MNVQRIKPALDKVNSYYAHLLENQARLSQLDRDAFLAAIRELYDACIYEGEQPKSTTPPPQIQTPIAKPVSTPTQKEEKKKRPKLVFTSPTTEEEQPVADDSLGGREPSLNQPKEETKTKPTPPTSQGEVPTTPVQQPPVPIEEPQEEPTPVETSPDNSDEEEPHYEEYEELFEFKEATDLSQKLSAAPLEDLSKALGMNEKYLYINELFGGDVASFQAALKELNKGENFDTARRYLEQQVIGQHNWMEKNKKIIAKNFVKLVRRRYL